jgi:hypothetical protein
MCRFINKSAPVLEDSCDESAKRAASSRIIRDMIRLNKIKRVGHFNDVGLQFSCLSGSARRPPRLTKRQYQTAKTTITRRGGIIAKIATRLDRPTTLKLRMEESLEVGDGGVVVVAIVVVEVAEVRCDWAYY